MSILFQNDIQSISNIYKKGKESKVIFDVIYQGIYLY